MAAGVGLLEVLDGQASVVLEGVEGFVPEQCLDVVEIGSTPNQLPRATPAKRVRRHSYLAPDSIGIPVHLPPQGCKGKVTGLE